MVEDVEFHYSQPTLGTVKQPKTTGGWYLPRARGDTHKTVQRVLPEMWRGEIAEMALGPPF